MTAAIKNSGQNGTTKNEGKAAAAKRQQDVDSHSIKEVQKNDPAAVVKEKPTKAAPASKTPEKEDQVSKWAAGAYSVDKKSKNK